MRYAARTVQGVEAYYTALDVALQGTGDPAEILGWMPELNAYREYLFDEETLNQKFGWEIALEDYWKYSLEYWEEMLDKLPSISCNDDAVAGCFAWTLGESGAGWAIGKGAEWVMKRTFGAKVCGICFASPEPVSKVLSCAGCAAWLGYEIYSKVSTMYTLTRCVTDNCEMNW